MSRGDENLRPTSARGGLAGQADPELVQQIRLAGQGDAAAMGWLFDRYQQRVLRFCLSFGPLSEADGQDLVQEVFVRALRGLGRLRDPLRFDSWLFAIARRRCLTHLGRLGRRRKDLARWATEQRGAEDPGDAERSVRQLEVQVVAEEIERLDESNWKRVGQMYYQQGLSTQAIADALGVGQSTVTTWLSRFRARIRRRLVARILALRGHPGGR